MDEPRPGLAALVILAAGSGSRAGGPKAWIRVKGRPWLLRQLDLLPQGFFSATRVVISEPPLDGILLPPEPTFMMNPRPELGPFHSIQLGLAGLTRARPVFILPVDVPAPAQETFWALAGALGKAWAAIPLFEGHGGHPVALSPRACADILAADPALPGSRLDFFLRERDRDVVRLSVSDANVVENFNSEEDFQIEE